MKHMKRIFALALAVMMLLSLAFTASAAEEPTDFTITIKPPQDGSATLEKHTYAVYQIFTGAMSVNKNGEKILIDVKFGASYQPAGVEVDDELDFLKTKTGEEVAVYLEENLTDRTPFETLSKEEGFSITVPTGYYLIVDTSTDLPAGETSSAFVLELTDDTDVYSKHTADLKVVKKIDDTNDSVDAEDEIDWQDSADHDIGDEIPFKLEMTVPSVFAQFEIYDEEYKFVFHDVEEDGLSFLNDAKVYVDGTEITDGFTVNTAPADGCSFEVIFADLTAIDSVKVGSVITVVYHSELTEDAVLGKQGNVNKVRGEFANLHRPDYPTLTPWDSVIAFTYKVVVNKVDENEAALPGAEFTLEKYNAETGAWESVEKVDATADTVFVFEGLDDGDYQLTETETPPGYNSIEPIKFTVTAEHNIKWENTERTDILTSLTGNVTTGEITFSAIENNEGLTTKVENKSGTVLPETGGIGTTIFYTVGAILVLVAVVLLVTKKRMASAE